MPEDGVAKARDEGEEGDGDTTGGRGWSSDSRNITRANYISLSSSLSLSPFLVFSLYRLLRGFSSSPSCAHLVTLLIADDVTPRPCHVARAGKMADRGSGETAPSLLLSTRFIRVVLSSRSSLFPARRKNLSLASSPQGGVTRTRPLARLWRVLNRRILHGGLIPPVLRSLLPFLALSLSLSRSHSLTPGSFRFIFYSHILMLVLLTFFFFSSFLSCPLHQSSLSLASDYFPFSSHPFFLITGTKRKLATLISRPRNAVIRGLKRWRCVVFPNLFTSSCASWKMLQICGDY